MCAALSAGSQSSSARTSRWRSRSEITGIWMTPLGTGHTGANRIVTQSRGRSVDLGQAAQLEDRETSTGTVREHRSKQMPYRSNAELPASVRTNLPYRAQDIYRRA